MWYNEKCAFVLLLTFTIYILSSFAKLLLLSTLVLNTFRPVYKRQPRRITKVASVDR